MNIIELDEYRANRNSAESSRHQPIRPHDPADRILIGKITASPLIPKFSTWEIRAFDRTGPFHLYFSTHQMLHLQFWNPYYGVSVLTPSKITGHHYEAFPLYDWKLASKSYAEIGLEIRKHFSTALPALEDVDTLASDYYAIGETPDCQTQTPNEGAL